MMIGDRYCSSIWADEKTYVDNADYRDCIAKRIQDDLSKALITALCTKDAIVAIRGDSTTRKDEFRCGIICRQDIYIKDLVQCKDCKHHQYEEPGMVYCPKVVGGWVSNNFYCGAAERKEAEE